jgi:aminomethyltransferase
MSDHAAEDLQKTPIWQKHVDLGAKMVPFGGWHMPVQYSGIIQEHNAVRTQAGLFDVSHMGQFRIKGPRASECLEQLVTNHVGKLTPGQAVYTPMCRNNGGIVDDLIVYRLWPDEFMVVVNASNIEKDKEWIQNHLTSGIDLLDESEQTALIALQGPLAQKVSDSLGMRLGTMPFFHFRDVKLAGARCIAARTGYTGEDGFEFFVPAESAAAAWDELLAHEDVTPCGLGARDTLRLEAGLLLYGNDMTDDISPLEAGLGWTCKLKQDVSFNGRSVLEEQKSDGLKRKLVGLEITGRGIARHGYKVFDGDRQVGEVTSGTHSPTLGKAIAMAYVKKGHNKRGASLQVEIRNKMVDAKVIRPRFYVRKDPDSK